MGTAQDLHEVRAALSACGFAVQRAQRAAYRAHQGGAVSAATLRRINALLEVCRDNLTDVGTTMRAETLAATPGPTHIGEVLQQLGPSSDVDLAEHRLEAAARQKRCTHPVAEPLCNCTHHYLNHFSRLAGDPAEGGCVLCDCHAFQRAPGGALCPDCGACIPKPASGS